MVVVQVVAVVQTVAMAVVQVAAVVQVVVVVVCLWLAAPLVLSSNHPIHTQVSHTTVKKCTKIQQTRHWSKCEANHV